MHGRWGAAPGWTDSTVRGLRGPQIEPHGRIWRSAKRPRRPTSKTAITADISVCAREPFWPNETKARLDDAAFGPLRNAAGQYLTAVAHHRLVLRSPAPEGLIRGYPEGADDLVRGLGLRVDQGVLWICELLLSKAQMITAAKELGSD